MNRASLPFLIIAALAAVPASADAYCLEGTLRQDNTTTVRYDIPVYLLTSSTDFLGIPTAYVEHEIKMALDEWTENCDCNFRPYYAGLTTNSSSEGRVVVRQDMAADGIECSSSATACEQTNHDYVPPFGYARVGSQIWMVNDGSWWSLASFRKIFTHEVGHAFGLEDTYAPHCSNGAYTNGGVMGSGALFNASSLGLDDQLGMQALYGGREYYLAHRQTTDLATWSPSIQFDSTITPFDFPLGSSTSGAPHERLAFASNLTTPITTTTIAACDNGSCTGVERASMPLGSATYNMVSVANKSADEFMVVYGQGETQTDGNRFLKWQITQDGGATFLDGFIVTASGWPTMTAHHGVTASYDQRTDRYLVAWRRTSGQISLASVQAEAPYQQGAITNTSYLTWRTPSVECTPQAYVPTTDTCLLVWASDVGLHPIWRTRVGIFASTGNPVASASYGTSSLIAYGMPALTETRRTDYPWMIAAKQGNEIRAWKRTAGGNWTGSSSVAFGGVRLLSPSLSHAYDGETAEIHVRYGW